MENIYIHVKFLKLYLRLCDKIPRDAVAHLGFRVGNGVIYHIVKRPGGIHIAAARCDECLFYKLMTRSYVFGTPMIIDGRLRVIVADTHAVRRLLGEHISQVIKAEPLSRRDPHQEAEGGPLSLGQRPQHKLRRPGVGRLQSRRI
jgi:hypothetical protein